MILAARKNLLLLHFFLSMNFSLSLCNAYYNFKVDYVHYVSWVIRNSEVPTTGFKLPWNNDTNELKKMCVAAKEHTVLGVITSLRDGSIDWFGPGPARIVEETDEKVIQHSEGPFTWVMLCKTQPAIWLRAGDEYNEIIILMSTNNCNLSTQLYKFDVERINFEPMPIPPDNPADEELIKRDNSLQAEVGACAWWYICEVAKKYAESLTPTRLKSRRVIRQLLEFSNNNGEEKHMTLTCPSEPSTYAYFGTSLYDVKIKILF